MPERHEAVGILYELINSGILNEETVNALEDIAKCIDSERDGFDIWGAKEDDWVELYIARREDLITPEYEAKMNAIYQKYKN